MRVVVRSLWRRPGFVVLGAGSVAFALAVCVVALSIIDAAEHPYVPFAHPEQLFRISQRGDGASEADKYAALRTVPAFSDGFAYESGNVGAVTVGSGAETDWVESVSPSFFGVIGVAPELGRLPAPGQSTDNVAVVSHALWQRLYDGRPVLGDASVTIDDRTYPIVGVLPPGMPEATGADVWLPVGSGAEMREPIRSRLMPIVRLPAGTTPAIASAQLATLALRLTASYGAGRVPFAYDLRPLAPEAAPLKATHAALLGAAICVLLIACANLANLILARGLAQRRDLALRLALGATRGALIRKIVADVSVVAIVGTAAGCWGAFEGMRVVMHRMPSQAADAGLFVLTFNWRVFACIAGALACTIAIAGLVPALRLTRDVPSDHLKGAAGTTTGRVHRSSGFVIAQVALSMTLVMGAGLLVKAARRINDYQFGYDAARLLGTWVHFGPWPHNAGDSGAAQLRDLIASIAHTDDVASAASIAYAVPVGRAVESALPGGGNRRLLLHRYSIVSPDFLRTLGLPVIAGRDFAPGDAVSGAGAVIVDEAVARQLWPAGGAVGGQIQLGEDGNHLSWLPVVGITRQASLDFQVDPDLRPEPAVYAVLPADGSRFHRIAIRVAGRTDPGSVARVALAVHRAMDAAAPGAGGVVSPWREDFSEMVAGREFVAAVFGLVAALALGLAATGLYGVLAYTVSQRTREFGIRLALGASRRSVFGLVLRDGAVMVLAGVGVGAIFAMWVAKLLSVWLYTVHPTDAGTLVGAEAVLLVVSVCACVVPGLRAMRADPGDVMRAA